MKEVTIYIELLDEGTPVYRPARAQDLGGGRFVVLGPVPEEETWAFLPGTMVRCRQQTFRGGETVPVAYESVSAKP